MITGYSSFIVLYDEDKFSLFPYKTPTMQSVSALKFCNLFVLAKFLTDLKSPIIEGISFEFIVLGPALI